MDVDTQVYDAFVCTYMCVCVCSMLC